MDLLLALLIGAGVLFAYLLIAALIIAVIPIFVGLGIVAVATLIAYALLKSRH